MSRTNRPLRIGFTLAIGLAAAGFISESTGQVRFPHGPRLARLPRACFEAREIRGCPPQPLLLFDGVSLEGWTRRDGSPSTGWTASEGVLHQSGGAGDLYHRQTWRDFQLSFEWRVAAGGNSGVKYRVQAYGGRMLGCEFQILDDPPTARNRHSAGALYDVYAPSGTITAVPPGIWRQSVIRVCGQQIEHWLDGERVVEAQVGGLDWLQRVAASKFRNEPFFGQNREGRIFLQDHGTPVWFRHLVLLPLDGETPTSPAPALFRSACGRSPLSIRPAWCKIVGSRCGR